MKSKTWMWMGGVVCVLALGRAVASDPTVTVSSSISGTPPTLTATPTGSNGVTCTGDCCQASAGDVTFVYETSNGRFLYVINDSGTVSSSPPTTVSTGGSVDFSVVGANGTTSLLWDDPVITVQTGTCQ